MEKIMDINKAYLRLTEVAEKNKRLVLKLAVEKARSLAPKELTDKDVSKGIQNYRRAK